MGQTKIPPRPFHIPERDQFEEHLATTGLAAESQCRFPRKLSERPRGLLLQHSRQKIFWIKCGAIGNAEIAECGEGESGATSRRFAKRFTTRRALPFDLDVTKFDPRCVARSGLWKQTAAHSPNQTIKNAASVFLKFLELQDVPP